MSVLTHGGTGRDGTLTGLWRWSGLALVLALLLLLATGCATVRPADRIAADPWEGFNRAVYQFNDVVDQAAVKPAAEVYKRIVPGWLRKGVDNMYGNIGDVWSSVNLLLQAKPQRALDMGLRVGINSLFGVGGFFDVADDLGIERNSSEDFGQTLGRWGVQSGPYLVVPLLGPSTVRDTAGLVVDSNASGPGQVLRQPQDRNAATVLRLLNARVQLLTASQLLDDIALDKYVLLRDAYLARRRSQVFDGNPPDEAYEPMPADGTPRR